MLSNIQKKYKDRYRTQFCDQDFYKIHQNVFKMWKTKLQSLSDVEKLQAWVIGLSCLRRPTDWYGGKRQDIFLTKTITSKTQHSLTLKQLFEDTSVLISPKINSDMNLIDFINVCKIKAFPESCNRSLCFTASGRYPLIISDHTPTPLELLEMQISGTRIITLNEDYENWPTTLYSNRDFLGFVMHDLIHADHFFFMPLHRDGQLGFFNFTKNILNEPDLNQLLTSESFKSGFEYIISDMNSHPVHLFQTLRALLLTETKNDDFALKSWQNWVEKTNSLTPFERESLSLINSLGFSDDHARAIELLCIRLGRQSST